MKEEEERININAEQNLGFELGNDTIIMKM